MEWSEGETYTSHSHQFQAIGHKRRKFSAGICISRVLKACSLFSALPPLRHRPVGESGLTPLLPGVLRGTGKKQWRTAGRDSDFQAAEQHGQRPWAMSYVQGTLQGGSNFRYVEGGGKEGVGTMVKGLYWPPATCWTLTCIIISAIFKIIITVWYWCTCFVEKEMKWRFR